MRWLWVVALAVGCSPAYRVKAESAAARLMPTCSTFAVGADDYDGWLWPGVGCGRRFWCSYDERGAMRCDFHPNKPTPRELSDAAQVAAHCSEPAVGREVNGDLWQVYLCGKAFDCEDRGPWACREVDRVE